jgi:DNA repair ATPase RecN
MKQTKKEKEEQKRLEFFQYLLAMLAPLSDRFDEVEHLYQEKEKLVNKISRSVKWKKAKIKAKRS